MQFLMPAPWPDRVDVFFEVFYSDYYFTELKKLCQSNGARLCLA